jgi:hypothetical protein
MAGGRGVPDRRTDFKVGCIGCTAGAIQVDFPKGHVCVSGSVDGEALRIVLEHLLR